MSTDDRSAEEFLPLTPAVYEILLSLAEGPCHGYAIMQEVEERTGGQVVLRPGTLYRAVHRLLERGLVDEVATDGGDERRRTYRLTDLGLEVLQAEVRRMERAVDAAAAKRLPGTGR